MGNQKSFPHKVLLLSITVICLGLGIYLRYKYSSFFLNIGTISFSAVSIFQGFSDHKALLFSILPHIFKGQLLPGFFIPEILLFAGIYTLAKALDSSKLFEKVSLFAEGLLKNRLRVIVIICSIIIIAAMSLVFLKILGGMPVSTDEFAYSFQSELLKSFRLYAPVPENSAFYPFENLVMHEGKWFAKYTIGFPLLLAPGALLGIPWIVNPLLACLTLLILYKLTALMFDKKSAVFAVLIAALSPFFFFNGAAAFQPHISLACVLLGAAWYYWKAVKENGWHNSMICGFLFAAGSLIRPADAAIWAGVFCIISIIEFVGSHDRKLLLRKFAVSIFSGCLGLAVVLFINHIQTGNYMQFSFQLYQGKEVWGLGAYEHNIFKALWNSFYSLSRLLCWSVPFIIEGALAAFAGKEKKFVSYQWLMFLAFTGFFFGWYAIGHYEYGPRYLFTGFVFLIPAAGYGISVVFDKVGKKFVSQQVVEYSSLLIVLIYCVVALFPSFFPVFTEQAEKNVWVKFVNSSLKLSQQCGKEIAVFIVGAPDNKVNNGTRNYAPPESNKAVKLLFLEPEANYKLLKENYSGRDAFIAFYRPEAREYVFEPMPEEDKITPETLSFYQLFAGMSYRFGAGDSNKAQEVWLKAFEKNEANLAPIINIANMHLEDGKLELSKKYWELVMERNPSLSVSYASLGAIYEDWGDREKCLKYYLEFLRLQPDSNLSEKIKDKIHYYQINGRFPEEKGK